VPAVELRVGHRVPLRFEHVPQVSVRVEQRRRLVHLQQSRLKVEADGHTLVLREAPNQPLGVFVSVLERARQLDDGADVLAAAVRLFVRGLDEAARVERVGAQVFEPAARARRLPRGERRQRVLRGNKVLEARVAPEPVAPVPEFTSARALVYQSSRAVAFTILRL
jgi:hypothetical protein